MKVSELYNQVAQLGFEDTLENSNRFYYALYRSVFQTNLLRPRKSTVRINHYPLNNGIANSSFTPVEHNGSPTVYTAESPKAYYFEAQGRLVCHIDLLLPDGEWEPIKTVDVPYSKSFTGYSGLIQKNGEFLCGTVRLRFEGEFRAYVCSVALYTDVWSESEEDIPRFAPYPKYCLRDYESDFLSLPASPVRLNDVSSPLGEEGYRIEGGDTLLFPYDKQGCYVVSYNRLPLKLDATISPGEDERVIDLDEDLCSLLPLLIAVYNLASDEPELANAYKAMYQERAAEIAATERRFGNATFVDTTNWG